MPSRNLNKRSSQTCWSANFPTGSCTSRETLVYRDATITGTVFVKVSYSRNFESLVCGTLSQASITDASKCRNMQHNQYSPNCPICRKRVAGKEFLIPFTTLDLTLSASRKRMKYWYCLFTCLTTRAVQNEEAEGLQKDAYMIAIRKFMARRGRHHTIMMNIGTNSTGSAQEIEKISIQWDQTVFLKALAQHEKVWGINCLGALKFAGVWERLVRTCKKAVYSKLGTKSFTLLVFTKKISRVEQTLKAHPHTPLSNET